ncbi:hypothetical protein [Bosea sp. 117]|uniref:hypothetical protein n=1 Tax=Bosea sp. 117 TaxID=1125973 RepID=UPI000A69032A|nr:hypothetical protein [Bosea sp. 117]
MMRLSMIVLGVCVSFAGGAEAKNQAAKPMKNRSAADQEKHARCAADAKAKYGDMPSARAQRDKATAACDAKP